MEKEIISSFIISQIGVSAGEAFQVILCVSFELVSLTCLGVSKQKPSPEKESLYVSVRFGCPFFWQVCWMCVEKLLGFVQLGHLKHLHLQGLSCDMNFLLSGFFILLIKMCDPRCIYYCLTWVGYLSFLKSTGLFVCIFLFYFLA